MRIQVKTCQDCPFLYQNGEFPASLCTVTREDYWPMGYYRGGPAPKECPLRTSSVLVEFKKP
jgi:hypothetical protein